MMDLIDEPRGAATSLDFRSSYKLWYSHAGKLLVRIALICITDSETRSACHIGPTGFCLPRGMNLSGPLKCVRFSQLFYDFGEVLSIPRHIIVELSYNLSTVNVTDR